MNIKISLLKHCALADPQLAEICFNTLGKWYPNVSLYEISLWFNEWYNEDIPLALVALKDNNTAIGMCSLQMNDGIRQDLFPWLGDLCIDPQYQKKGAGKLLIEAAKDKTRELGFKKLHLFTPDENLPSYYMNLGWNII